MKWVVGLLHRQAIKVKAEGLFFRVRANRLGRRYQPASDRPISQTTTLELFQRILRDEKLLPKEQPYLDLVTLVKFILRKFFKAVAEDPFILVEAWYFHFIPSRSRLNFLVTVVLPSNPKSLEANFRIQVARWCQR